MAETSVTGATSPPPHDPRGAESDQSAQECGHQTCNGIHRVFESLDHPSGPLAKEVISAFNYPPGSALSMSHNSCPTRGQTTCLGKMELQLEYGDFTAYLFRTRDVNGYVIALTKGDITSDENLLIRTHSECITSETLCACDCDCVEQLNGALEQISNEGRGVLFYLRQEGRGAGYEAKAMDRMMVIASKDELGTFDAYNLMGLPRDARDYSSINDIVYLLGINAGLELMTNNHRKRSGLEEHGLKVAGTRTHSYPANPFNLHYMRTKGEIEAHTFKPEHIKQTDGDGHIYPDNKVHQSYVLQDALRFIHRATYWLPIRPPTNERILPAQVMVELGTAQKLLGQTVIESFGFVEGRTGAVKVKLNESAMSEIRAKDPHNPVDALLARHPYFFNNHVYLDESTNLVFPVLQHEGDSPARDNVPVVRIHTESIVGRFPLIQNPERDTFRKSVQKIVEKGRGLVLLYPKDGRGNGIGSVFKEADLIRRGEYASAQEACRKIGTKFDGRDYTAVARLIKHHYATADSTAQVSIDLILSPLEGQTERVSLFAALNEENISIRKYLELE